MSKTQGGLPNGRLWPPSALTLGGAGLNEGQMQVASQEKGCLVPTEWEEMGSRAGFTGL